MESIIEKYGTNLKKINLSNNGKYVQNDAILNLLITVIVIVAVIFTIVIVMAIVMVIMVIVTS